MAISRNLALGRGLGAEYVRAIVVVLLRIQRGIAWRSDIAVLA